MIPKIVHYCWFGGNPLPEDAVRCIESWKKYLPDYEIRQWNEENFDLNCCQYVKEAYQEKKWAFIADYVRLFALVNEGGIYMDTDVEVCKPLDEFLSEQAFSGFETDNRLLTGLMGCEKGYPVFEKLLKDYQTRSFYRNDGSLNMTTNVTYFTNEFTKRGVVLNNRKQTAAGMTFYPMEYFCAKSWESGIVTRTENTYTIHHYAASWLSDKDAQLLKKMNYCYSHFGILAKPVFWFYKYILHPSNLRDRLKKHE